MSYQTTNYLTVPTSPNPYVTQKLNNIDEAKALKKERKDLPQDIEGNRCNDRCAKTS